LEYSRRLVASIGAKKSARPWGRAVEDLNGL
jgi:hypothetical protein